MCTWIVRRRGRYIGICVRDVVLVAVQMVG